MNANKMLKDSSKTILLGILFAVVGALLWYSIVGNPFHDLALITRGKTTPGFITDTWEEVESGDEGGSVWFHGASYKYTLLSGREFTKSTGCQSGRLNKNFRNLQELYPIEVEYLPDNPEISRIKGDGNTTLIDWLWRKAGIGTLLLAICLAPGFAQIQIGFSQLRACKPNC